MAKIEIAGYSYLNKPRYSWYCPKCKFITCVETYFDNENSVFTDVYLSCSSFKFKNGEIRDNEFIMVFSEEPGDYHSSITMGSLFAHYISDTHR